MIRPLSGLPFPQSGIFSTLSGLFGLFFVGGLGLSRRVGLNPCGLAKLAFQGAVFLNYPSEAVVLVRPLAAVDGLVQPSRRRRGPLQCLRPRVQGVGVQDVFVGEVSQDIRQTFGVL
jgi:hypothetical protein